MRRFGIEFENSSSEHPVKGALRGRLEFCPPTAIR
jgi:hypothetical protein